MQLAASQLKNIGVDVSAEIVENITDTGVQGDFDIMFYAQHTAPTGNPVFYLSQAFKTNGPNNFTGYSSEAFDDLLAQMAALPAGEERDRLTVDAQNVLFEDLPVLYLVDPQWHVAVSDRLKNYQPWCGDYYIINSDLGIQ
jgi:peptide/nickel transport system substrate-binding protein